MPSEKLFKCPRCGRLSNHLLRVTYRDHRRKDDPRTLSEGPYFKKHDFCCPNCGVVVAHSCKKARCLLTESEEKDKNGSLLV